MKRTSRGGSPVSSRTIPATALVRLGQALAGAGLAKRLEVRLDGDTAGTDCAIARSTCDATSCASDSGRLPGSLRWSPTSTPPFTVTT